MVHVWGVIAFVNYTVSPGIPELEMDEIGEVRPPRQGAKFVRNPYPLKGVRAALHSSSATVL